MRYAHRNDPNLVVTATQWAGTEADARRIAAEHRVELVVVDGVARYLTEYGWPDTEPVAAGDWLVLPAPEIVVTHTDAEFRERYAAVEGA